MEFITKHIHAHDVIDMLRATNKSYTRKELEEKIVESYGKQALYCTCSNENLELNELIEVLKARGKLEGDDNNYKPAEFDAC